jgi:hypothetical protein
MHAKRLVILLASLLAGCASGTGTETKGLGIVDVIATPPYLALKVPTCAFNVAVAAPLAALSQLAQPWPPVPALYPNTGDSMVEFRRSLNADVTHACGPPYIVSGSKD